MQCCVPFCVNTSDNASTSEGTGITFHKLPSEENLRAAWLRALGIQDHRLPDPAVVCSQHFIDEDFYITKSCVRQIRSDAIPSTVQIKSESVVGDVPTLVLKREDSSDSMSNADNLELVHKDDNQRHNSNNDCVSEDKYSNVSIKLEPRPVEKEDAFPATAEHMVEIEISIKSESTVFGCTLCYEDFVQEDAYNQHMNMHLQNAACDASQVCEPRAAVSRSCDSLVLQNKTGSQRLNDAPPPAAGCAQTTVAPLSGRLAAKDIKVEATEEAAATCKREQILETDIGELDNQLSLSNVVKSTNCVVPINNNFKKPKKTLLGENARVKIHTGAKAYSEACNYKNENENHLLIRKTHTGDKPYSCELCSYKSADKSKLLRHNSTHTGEKPYSCELCSYKSADKSKLLRHNSTHTGGKPFSCKTCTFKTASNSLLLIHESIHNGEKPYSCDICNYKTAKKDNLMRHKKTHTGEKPFSCEICNYKAARKSHLLIHKRTHTGEKPYSCDMCNFKSVKKDGLIPHMKKHTREKPFSCNICNYKCSQKHHLLYHMKTHTGEKPFSCEMCSYKTASKSCLLLHERNHTGEKPYSCDTCNYKTAKKENLMRHKKTHTGEKPFSCEACNYKAARKSHLLRHKRTHTGEKPLS